jgi:hypothetical protein
MRVDEIPLVVKENASRRRCVGRQVMMILRAGRFWFLVKDVISLDVAVRRLGIMPNVWMN